ncbi:MAG: major facilitator superfamily domain-containing protein [Linnemannia gamsii]|nr:MAG: major facilitator superfamily domain-containing protein [Linnemannia gamsii]
MDPLHLDSTTRTAPGRGRRLSAPPRNIDELTQYTTSTSPSAVNPIFKPRNPKSGGSDPSSSSSSTWVPVKTNGSIRWPMLAAACFIMFGNYFAFDNPAVLNKPLQEFMAMTDDQFAYFLNLLYTSYSIPNVVLPWLGGYAADRFGHNKLLVVLSILVVLGHLVVCLGLERRNIGIMILGRVIFGSGESLAVAQSAITVKYFRGKELAMALGINLCVSRMGGVLNDLVTPIIWSKSSVPFAFWCGLLVCIFSMFTAFVLVAMDLRFNAHVGVENKPLERSRPSSCLIDARLSMDGFSHANHTLFKQGSPPSIQDIAMGQLSNTDGQQYKHHGHPEKKTILQRCIRQMRPLFDYSPSFWILFVMGFLLVGIIVPFNSIHAGFLQMRWFPGDPLKAAQIMTIPDLLSGVLVLPVGYFVDHYGQKTWLFILCGLITGTAHIFLGLIKIKDPFPCLIFLGVSSAIGAIFSSAVPVLVRSDQMATAYGILTSAYNLSFVVLPMVVAKLMTVDPTVYTYTEIFFASIGFFGAMLAVWLKLLDRNGDLDRREIDNNTNN